MTNDFVISLGEFCEELMRNEYFNVLTQQYETQCFQHMMTTKDHETKAREGIFFKWNGVKDFLQLMKACVEAKEKLIAPSPPDAQQYEDY